MNTDLQSLRQQYENKPWFADVGTDQYGRYVVYMKEICHGSLHDVADYHNGKQVLVHFVAHKNATREQYVAEKPTLDHVESTTETNELARRLLTKSKLTAPIDNPRVGSTLQSFFEETGEWAEVQAGALKKTLVLLEEQIGIRSVQDIFWETNDKENAVSDLSSTYPDVRKTMDGLYDEFGFDVLHDALGLE